ncbi:MAG: DUF1574 domain-containing protein [Spirochaetia bacterium]|nr:DUF1574 domain-containing protein [Spirochaetia bacterium]
MKISWKLFLTPILAIATLFILDKAFLFPEVRDHFLQPGGMVYYRQRQLQIERMHEFAQRAPANIKLAVVLGDSRAFALGDLPARYIGKNDWKIYNFAGPQASPAYFYYMAKQLFNGAKRPGYLMLEISPESFNRNSRILGSTVLNHGVDSGFVNDHRTMIPEPDLLDYIDTRRYALFSLPFSFKEFVARWRGGPGPSRPAVLPMSETGPISAADWQNGLMMSLQNVDQHNMALYSTKTSREIQFLDFMSGSQYVWFGSASDEVLKADTDRIAGIYLKNFKVSEEQVYFFRKTLELAERARVKTIVFWPQVNPHLQKILDADPRFPALKTRLTRDAVDRKARVFDLAELKETRCSHFYDASHLSIECFPDITRFLLDRLAEP